MSDDLIQPQSALPFEALQWPLPRRLTPAETKYLKATLRGDADALIASADKFEVHRSDLDQLAGGRRLNDNIMNFYLALAVTRVRELGPNVHFITSFISMLFRDDGYKRTWNNELDPFVYDKLVLPLHSPDHWAGVGVDVVHHVLWVGDSIGTRYETELVALKDWLKSMYRRKYNREDPRDWSVEQPPTPMQNNDLDCGMFTLLFCIGFLLGTKCNNLYSCADIPEYRRLFALHIISTGLTNTKIKSRAYPPSSTFIRIQNVLRQETGLSAVNITARLNQTGEHITRNLTTKTLKRKVKAGLLISEGTFKSTRYYLNDYAATMTHTIVAKKPQIARYAVPRHVKKYTFGDAIISVLHRYKALNRSQITTKLQVEGYVTDARKIQSELRNLTTSTNPKLTKMHQQVNESYVYELAEGVLPPMDLTEEQHESGAVFKKIGDTRYIIVSADAQRNFLRIADSSLGGQGCFLTQYVGAGVLFEVKFTTLSDWVDDTSVPRDQFMFTIEHENHHTLAITTNNDGDVQSWITFANDAGPICSHLEPVFMDIDDIPRLFWKTRRPIDAGTELFCAYNFGPGFHTSHWKFTYPGDWTVPDAVDPNKLQAVMEADAGKVIPHKKRRQKESEPTKKRSKPKRQKLHREQQQQQQEPKPEPKLIVRKINNFW